MGVERRVATGTGLTPAAAHKSRQSALKLECHLNHVRSLSYRIAKIHPYISDKPHKLEIILSRKTSVKKDCTNGFCGG